jgi:hypothetical protein
MVRIRRLGQAGSVALLRGKGVAMNGRILLIAMLLPVVAGCESYTWVTYNNPSIADARQGQDCRTLVFGLGGSVDPTGIQAMRLGDITRARSTEYRVKTIQGVGSECVIAHGE